MVTVQLSWREIKQGVSIDEVGNSVREFGRCSLCKANFEARPRGVCATCGGAFLAYIAGAVVGPLMDDSGVAADAVEQHASTCRYFVPGSCRAVIAR